MKFVHAADLHIDSPRRALERSEDAPSRPPARWGGRDVLFWSPERRNGLQQLMLRRYQSTARYVGIDYDWEQLQLWWDYRLCVAQCAVHAVEWLVVPEDREKQRELWTIQLERTMAAFFELECREL